jgi:hypothetical protein
MANVEVDSRVKLDCEPSCGDLPGYEVQLQSEWQSLSEECPMGQIVIDEV